MRLVQPSAMLGSRTFWTMRTMQAMNPTTAKMAPRSEATRSGTIEKSVTPSSHCATRLLRV